ncbi:MAG TPA: aconitase X catalytic domain-containing protein, partial [Syntrophorhabdaceae bacterium]|nr:aconitase X catalytic domain-containing protein [Syntrophorhabdaceae bacterium]
MKLTNYEEDLLKGKYGPVLKRCMEILVAVGECYEAESMVPVTSVHIAGNYPVLMDEGVEWLEELANEGLKVKVFTTKNPEMFDFEDFKELNVPERFIEKQLRIDKALKSLGVTLFYSCHHYLLGNTPRFKDHIAWASSGSQVYANSIIGARSNRDGDHVGICAALTGVVPAWGMHLDENRKGQILIDVTNLDFNKLNHADCQALGWQIGKKIGEKTPVFKGLPPNLNIEKIKGLLYTITVTGAIGMVHLVGITPEAPTVEAAFGTEEVKEEPIVISKDEIYKAYGEISSAKDEKVDLVIFGCPQCTIQDIEKAAQLLEGKKVHKDTELWICTSRWCKELSKRMGLIDIIKKAGGRLVAD